ncbi:aminopeptidase P family protein [Clostridium celatum]|uniref:aminopeptidase P family protein n=1 Tax=Clostridium celatum TaxID=36834 RepID=UPI00290289B0|nr:aminopeptidase P family protein [Clostridium celatum]MDU2266490.1 aminopeptidase P family protein [Clostridium celatum]MDU6296789.1 aminopeptidase P family protein [Clostridium celatum]
MDKLLELRKIMNIKGINHYIITSSDPHQSEYAAEYYKGRAYISGFTGSAGTLLVSEDSAKLWTDGRYFIQAENQLKGTGIDLMKMNEKGYPTLNEWIENNVNENENVGFYGSCYSCNDYKKLLEISRKNKFNIAMEEDLLQQVWENRPSLPSDEIFLHDSKFAGKTASEKIKEVREKMEKLKAENYIISSLDDIAWLFNIRGTDVKFTPVAISYALISKTKAKLYIDINKVNTKVKENLNSEGIEIIDYSLIIDDIKEIKDSILIDPAKTNARIYSNINPEVKIIEGTNITTTLKAIKNKVEISNIEKSQVRDGVVMVKFIKWLRENIGKEKITEISSTNKLSALRATAENSKGDSFESIAGYKDHAAMMHYSATEESNYELKEEGLFLLDSGGQYLDGTTDITRTFALGNLTDEEKKNYTLVLKGHIGLAKAKFLKGANGSTLDILARKPLWDEGLDYKCGTGHGVGFFLSVHEGPQGIRPYGNTVTLEPGMIITNEPGVYKEGKYGIRIENTLLVVKDRETESGEFYKFDTISYCPIDLNAVVVDMLTEEEKNWLNNYHKTVFEKLNSYLSKDEVEFLKQETREI